MDNSELNRPGLHVVIIRPEYYGALWTIVYGQS